MKQAPGTRSAWMRALVAAIVGASFAQADVATAASVAFVDTNGTFQTLAVPGTNLTLPTGINDSGQIVGSFYRGPSGFLYSGGTFTTIDSPQAPHGTYVSGINNAGQIVGGYFGDYIGETLVGDAFVYQNGTFNYISADALTILYGISNSGTFVGSACSAHCEMGRNAIVGSLSGGVAVFSHPSAAVTDAYGINIHGQIVGSFFDSTYTHGGSFLKEGDTYTPIDFPGARFTSASGINDAGDIVGTFNGSHGFLYSKGVYTQIDFPNSTSTTLSGINNLGQIVGNATVVPEPAPLVLISAGMLGVLMLRKRYANREL